MRKLFTLFFLVLFFCGFSVKRNVPSTYSTIQSALNACGTGDTVLVQPGTYVENIYWPKTMNIKLFSAGDSSNTYVDANFSGRCFTIVDSTKTLIDGNTIISGFKLINGYSDTASFNGTAIYSYGNELIIENCAITNCNVNAINSNSISILNGGVIYFEGKIPTFRKNSVYGNSIYNSSGQINGGLIYTGYGSSILEELEILNNRISIFSNGNNYISGAFINCFQFIADRIKIINNKVDYIGTSTSSFYSFLYGSGSYCQVQNCLIASNTFSAAASVGMNSLVLYASTPSGIGYSYLTDLTVTDNKAITTGSITAISYYSRGGSSYYYAKNCYLTNCIFWNPYNTTIDEVAKSPAYCLFSLGFCDVRKSVIASVTSFSANPQFVSATDFHLQSSSPCISAGPLTSTISYDLDGNSRPLPIGTFMDVGCYERNQTTGSLTINAAIASNTICEYGFLCLYNSTPKSKNRIWTISPSVGSLPVYKDTACVQIYPAGNYTINLTVADSSNAIETSSFVIIAYPIPTVMPVSSGSNICTGQSATLTSSYTGTTSTVLWSNGATSPTTIVSPTISTTYTFTYTNIYGCGRSGSYAVNYTVSPPPSTTITASSNAICVGQSVTLTATSTGSIYSYVWNPTSGNTPSIVVSPSVNTTYTATIYNPYYCTDDTVITITVSLCTDIKGNILVNSEIIIFPNPNNGEFIVNSLIKENGFYEIYNCVGRKIKSGIVSEKTEISLREESSGIYFIKIFEDKKLISTRKIILNN